MSSTRKREKIGDWHDCEGIESSRVDRERSWNWVDEVYDAFGTPKKRHREKNDHRDNYKRRPVDIYGYIYECAWSRDSSTKGIAPKDPGETLLFRKEKNRLIKKTSSFTLSGFFTRITGRLNAGENIQKLMHDYTVWKESCDKGTMDMKSRENRGGSTKNRWNEMMEDTNAEKVVRCQQETTWTKE